MLTIESNSVIQHLEIKKLFSSGKGKEWSNNFVFQWEFHRKFSDESKTLAVNVLLKHGVFHQLIMALVNLLVKYEWNEAFKSPLGMGSLLQQFIVCDVWDNAKWCHKWIFMPCGCIQIIRKKDRKISSHSFY